jgi:hypothetical protein
LGLCEVVCSLADAVAAKYDNRSGWHNLLIHILRSAPICRDAGRLDAWDEAFRAAATGAISVKVAALTGGVMKSMFLNMLMKAMELLVVAALCGPAVLIYQSQAAQAPQDKPAVSQADDEESVAARGQEASQPRIWLLENRNEVTTIKPDGSDRRVLLVGQKMLRWVSPARRLVWFDGKDGRLPDPIPPLQPDGTQKRDGLTVHIRPFNDQPATPRQRQRIRQLIADLDSDAFTVREKASHDLAELGEVADADMRKALAGKTSAEARRRLQNLLEKLDAQSKNLGVPSVDHAFVARDGRTLLTRGRTFMDDAALIDAETGKRTPFKLPASIGWAVDLAPDRSWVLGLEAKKGVARLHKVPLHGGEPVLLTGRLFTSLGRISPDGERVVVTDGRGDLYVINVATQKATKLPAPKDAKRVWSWGEWSLDSQHLVCAWGEQFNGGKTRIAICDASGKEAKFILTADKCVVPIGWR